MGRNSSGVRGGLQPGDSGSDIEITGVEPLKNIKDPKSIKKQQQPFRAIIQLWACAREM